MAVSKIWQVAYPAIVVIKCSNLSTYVGFFDVAKNISGVRNRILTTLTVYISRTLCLLYALTSLKLVKNDIQSSTLSMHRMFI